MAAYYNEWDSFAADWLRELIKDKLIPAGVVDTRSIADVEAADIKEFTQCHFFAGIGGWSLALQLAGWDSSRPVWTGSPPCQPFSTAGNRKGQDDERHLWPVFFNLIRECQPPTVFGEQVAAAIRTGWFDDLQSDMENEGYATAMAVLPACSTGAPHKRERLFFVADSCSQRQQGPRKLRQPINTEKDKDREVSGAKYDSAQSATLANTLNTGQPSSEGRGSSSKLPKSWNNPWRSGEVISCRDGKYRQIPTEPEIFPLAHGISNRVGILRGAGNAIVPQAAAEIIKAYMEIAR